MKKLKVGILGCSNIAEKSLIPALLRSNGMELSGIYSRDYEKCQGFVSKFGGCAYENYFDLLNSEIDCVYVSVPTGLHYEYGRKVLQNGKHLLLEKSFTDSYEKTSELLEIAKRGKLVCMESLMYQWHPLQSQIQMAMENIGKVRSVEAFFGVPHFSDKSNIRYSRPLGGGGILDCFVYPSSFVLSVLGYNYVSLQKNVVRDDSLDVDECGFMVVSYPGSTGVVGYGFGCSYRNEISIWGEDGIIRCNRVFTRPRDLAGNIEIWKNGNAELIPIKAADHFLEMLLKFEAFIRGHEKHLYKSETTALMERAKLQDFMIRE